MHVNLSPPCFASRQHLQNTFTGHLSLSQWARTHVHTHTPVRVIENRGGRTKRARCTSAGSDFIVALNRARRAIYISRDSHQTSNSQRSLLPAINLRREFTSIFRREGERFPRMSNLSISEAQILRRTRAVNRRYALHRLQRFSIYSSNLRKHPFSSESGEKHLRASSSPFECASNAHKQSRELHDKSVTPREAGSMLMYFEEQIEPRTKSITKTYSLKRQATVARYNVKSREERKKTRRQSATVLALLGNPMHGASEEARITASLCRFSFVKLQESVPSRERELLGTRTG